MSGTSSFISQDDVYLAAVRGGDGARNAIATALSDGASEMSAQSGDGPQAGSIRKYRHERIFIMLAAGIIAISAVAATISIYYGTVPPA